MCIETIVTIFQNPSFNMLNKQEESVSTNYSPLAWPPELVVHLHRNMYMLWFNQKSTLSINPILFKMNALLNSLTGSIFQIINSLLYSCCTVCFTWHKYKSLFKSCMWLWLQLQKKLLQYRFPKLASCLREDALVNHITSLVGKSILNTK